MSEKTILCVECRSRYSEEELGAATCCPNCKTTGIPASLLHQHTVTLTDHEWRILFMWADSHAGTILDPSADRVMRALRAEARRQNLDMPNLSMHEDVQDIATHFQQPVEIVNAAGEHSVVMPQAKH